MRMFPVAPLVFCCCIVGALGLFPPLKSADTNLSRNSAWPTRGCLFNPNSFQVKVQYKEQALTITGEIDTGRLLAEFLIVGAASCIGIVLLAMVKSKHA